MPEGSARAAGLGDELRARLAVLEERDGRELDDLGCDHLRDLLARADSLGGRAGALLRDRAQARLARLEARCEGMRARRGTLVGADPEVQSRATEARQASTRRYREAIAEWTAVVSLARAVDQVPEEAGLLNGQRLAARALQAAGALSPLYLRSLTSTLADLAPLLALPEIRPPRKRSGDG